MDFYNQSYTNSLKEDLIEALNEGSVITSIHIHNKQYPSKLYSRTPIIVEFSDVLTLYKSSHTENKVVLSPTKITEITINVVKGFNNAPGPYLTQSLSTTLLIQTDEKQYKLICEDLAPIPLIMKWLKENSISLIDVTNLENLYSDYTPEEAIDYLYQNFETLEAR